MRHVFDHGFGRSRVGFLGCRSRSVLPDVKEVKVSRDEPRRLQIPGVISADTASAKGTPEQAMERFEEGSR